MRRAAQWVGCGIVILAAGCGDPGIAPLPPGEVEATAVIDGVEFKVAHGLIYRVDSDAERWYFHDTAYDPELVERCYITEGGVTYRVAEDTGKRYPVRPEFREDFEGTATGAAGLRELIGEARGWGAVTLQSPAAPEVEDYVALRRQILEGGGDFGDAAVAPSADETAGGERSLRCEAPACPGDMICCKASLSTPLVYFTAGDEVWFRAKYFLAGPERPYSLADLECEFLLQHAGIRIVLDSDGALAVELKAFDKPKYHQPAEQRVLLPLGQWVEITWAVKLAADDSGRVRLWQDGRLLLDASGRTLPLPSTIYNSLEVGISAHSSADGECVLYVDDIEVGLAPLAPAPR